MRNSYFIFLLLIDFESTAQTSIYHPFPDSNAEWRDIEADGFGSFHALVYDRRHFISGDTIIGGYQYHNLYTESSWSDESWPGGTLLQWFYFGIELKYALREDSLRRIYLHDLNAHIDTLLYDFGNLILGSYLPLTLANADSFAFVSAIDSVLIDSAYRKRYEISDTSCLWAPYNYHIIEGIGATTGLLNTNYCGSQSLLKLLCFRQNGELLIEEYFNMTHRCNSFMNQVMDDSDQLNISISPNPFHSMAKLCCGLQWSGKIIRFRLYNTLGKLIREETLKDRCLELERSSLPNGLYFFDLRNDELGLMQGGKFIID